MPEFGAVGEGYAIQDPEVDHMCESYAAPRSAYWVVTQAGVVVGGGGYAPLAGADDRTAELRKMYFLRATRGSGAGARLLSLCLEGAKQHGFRYVYLETLEHMHAAQSLYRKFGFEPLPSHRGSTGHFGCNAWYQKELI